MNKHYKDYYWDKGVPYGIYPIALPSQNEKTIKIVTDPYRKVFSIEEYKGESFSNILYDSKLLDFRSLTPMDQIAWKKETIEETPTQMTCLLRNQDDRVVFREVYYFENGLCRVCRTHSPHHLLLSIQKLHYKKLGDPFNGVILYDSNAHPVMLKKYDVDADNNYTKLLVEQWNLHQNPTPTGSYG